MPIWNQKDEKQKKTAPFMETEKKEKGKSL